MEKWNEYFAPSSSVMPQIAQVSEKMSRVPECVGTRLALDIFGDTANFANQKMNENVLNSCEENVQNIGG